WARSSSATSRARNSGSSTSYANLRRKVKSISVRHGRASNMKPFDPLHFTKALRDIRLSRAGIWPGDWEEQIRAAERAGHERGVVDGEKALSEQLLQQRNELLQ